MASPQEILLFLASLLLRIIKAARGVLRRRGGECEHLKRTEGDEKRAKPSALDVTMRGRIVAQIYIQSLSVRYAAREHSI